MTAEPVDLRGVLQSLDDHGVDFLLFGSAAMLFYGFVRATQDVDAVVQRIDGMPDWPELVADSEVYERDGVRVKVMNRRTLVALKRRRASALDLVDIQAIEQLDELGG